MPHEVFRAKRFLQTKLLVFAALLILVPAGTACKTRKFNESVPNIQIVSDRAPNIALSVTASLPKDSTEALNAEHNSALAMHEFFGELGYQTNESFMGRMKDFDLLVSLSFRNSEGWESAALFEDDIDVINKGGCGPVKRWH